MGVFGPGATLLRRLPLAIILRAVGAARDLVQRRRSFVTYPDYYIACGRRCAGLVQRRHSFVAYADFILRAVGAARGIGPAAARRWRGAGFGPATALLRRLLRAVGAAGLRRMRSRFDYSSHFTLLVPQRRGRIQAGGSERWEPRGQKCNRQEQHCDQYERHRIRGLDFHQHAHQDARK